MNGVLSENGARASSVWLICRGATATHTYVFHSQKPNTHNMHNNKIYSLYDSNSENISLRFPSFFFSCSHIFFSTIDSYLLFSLFLIFALSCRVGKQQWPFRCQTHLFQFLALLLLFRLLSVAFHQCKTHRAFDWYGNSEKCIWTEGKHISNIPSYHYRVYDRMNEWEYMYVVSAGGAEALFRSTDRCSFRKYAHVAGFS